MPIERALPIAVVVSTVTFLTGSVSIVKHPSGVGRGGAVPARLLLPVNLGRGMLLKMRRRYRTLSFNRCQNLGLQTKLVPLGRKRKMWKICGAAAGGGG